MYKHQAPKCFLRILSVFLALVIWINPSVALGEGLVDWLLSFGKQYLYGWEKGKTPYVEVDGIQLMPVYLSTDFNEILQVFGNEASYHGYMWYIRLEVLNGSFESKAVENAAQKLKMYLYDGGGYEIGSSITMVDENNPSVVHKYYAADSNKRITGIALRYQKINYSLDNLRDSATPMPVPIHANLPEDQEQAFREEMQSVYGMNADESMIFHQKGNKVFIAVFNIYEQVVNTSLDAKGESFCGIPANLIADSREDADEVIYIYRLIRWIGEYSDGTRAGEANAFATVIRGEMCGSYQLVSHNPPATKSGYGDRTGDYNPKEGLEIVVKRILEIEQGE